MGDKVDKYIATFETLVQKAGYDIGDFMVVQVFTNGLPTGLYEKILTIDNPHTYEGWRQCVLKRQEEFLHMKARREALDKTYGKKSLKLLWKPREVKDPNAMDTTPGRTRAWLSLTDDPPDTPPYPPRAGPGTKQWDMMKIKCYNCNQYGHIS